MARLQCCDGQGSAGMTVQGRRPVMHDVAALAGVSHQTVSRVLNGHPHVSPGTRQRVVAAMRELDYRPNLFARGLVTRRSRRIGVLSFDNRMYGPGSTLRAIERAARSRGFGVAIAGMLDHGGDEVDQAVEALQAQAVDGVIVIAPNEASVRAVGTLPRGMPVVALEAEYQSDQPVVCVDQFGGARLATQHLLDLGHETVWHVAGPSDWREAQLRVDGWRATLDRALAPAPPPLLGDWSPRSGHAAGTRIADRDDVTAVFAANDQMALGVIHALAQHGRRVPQDVSVVGFDDIPEAEYFLPPLTTVRQDFDEVGRQGLDLLLRNLGEPAEHHQQRLMIAPQLVVRDSASPR
jgi:DNA-binding LacI/PurR family transcriptional regulator